MQNNYPREGLADSINIVKNLNVDLATKTEIVLILLGFIPATSFQFDYASDTRDTVDKMKNDLISSGLEVRLTDEKLYLDRTIISPYVGIQDRFVRIYIASSIDVVERLMNVVERLKDQDSIALDNLHEYIPHSELAKLYGIPLTASKSFQIPGATLDVNSLPDDVKNQDFVKLCWFLLSKQHWQEELAIVKARYDALREYVPDLLAQLIDWRGSKKM